MKLPFKRADVPPVKDEEDAQIDLLLGTMSDMLSDIRHTTEQLEVVVGRTQQVRKQYAKKDTK
jgi:hypothetical protein